VTGSEITWVASRVQAESFAGLRALASSFGWDVLVDAPQQLMFRDARGAVIEYCTPEHPVPDYLFSEQDVVVGFLVADIGELLTRLPEREAQPIGTRTAVGEVEFQHLRRSDGTVFGLIAPAPRSVEAMPEAEVVQRL